MDPFTIAIIATGIASALALRKKRKLADEATVNVAARMGAEAGAEVVAQAAPGADKKSVTQKAMSTAASVALKAVPVVAVIVAIVKIAKKVKAARQARSAALRDFWPILTSAQQIEWISKKQRARAKKYSISRAKTLRKAEKAALASAQVLVAQGDEAVKARIKANMQAVWWYDVQTFAWYPTYRQKELAKQKALKRQAAMKAAGSIMTPMSS